MARKNDKSNVFNNFLSVIIFIGTIFCSIAKSSETTDTFPLKTLTKKLLPDAKNQVNEEKQLETNIKDLIETLQNPHKRENLINTLNLLIKTNDKQEDPFESLLSNITQYVQKKIQNSQEILYKLGISIYEFPNAIKGLLNNLAQDPYGMNLAKFFGMICASFTFGALLEILTSSVTSKYLFVSVKNDHTYFNKYPIMKFVYRFGYRFIPLFAFYIGVFVCLSAFVKPGETWGHRVLEFSTIISLMRFCLTFIMCVLEPKSPEFRSFDIAQEHASTLYSSSHILFWISSVGLVLGHFMILLGLEEVFVGLWAKIVGLIWSAVLVLSILRYKEPIANWLIFKIKMLSKTPKNTPKLVVSFASVLMKSWHVWTIGCIAVLYLVWIFDSADRMISLCLQLTYSVVLIIAYTWCNISFAQWYQRSKKFHKDRFNMGKRDLIQLTENPITVGVYLGKFLAPTFQFILSIVALVWVAKIWGIYIIDILSDSTYQHWILNIFEVFLIIMLTKILWLTTDLVVQHQLQPVEINNIIVEPSVFIKTIAPIIKTTIHIFLIFVCSLLVLKTLNFEILPLLYGFSLIGFALSLGSQSLVKDLINGILTLMEDNIAVGEMVKIGNETGMVESITLRSVFLRHSNGALQSIPFSEVASIINLSRDFGRCSFSIGFSYQTPLDQIYDVLTKAAKDLEQDVEYGEKILEPLVLTGVSHFTDTAVFVTGFFKVTPDPFNRILRKFQYFLKIQMDAAGISSPASRYLMTDNSQALG